METTEAFKRIMAASAEKHRAETERRQAFVASWRAASTRVGTRVFFDADFVWPDRGSCIEDHAAAVGSMA